MFKIHIYNHFVNEMEALKIFTRYVQSSYSDFTNIYNFCGTCKQLEQKNLKRVKKMNMSLFATETLKKLCKMVSTDKKRVQKTN